MIQGLNFYFQILQNETPNALETMTRPNNVPLDNAGQLSETNVKAVPLQSGQTEKYWRAQCNNDSALLMARDDSVTGE